MYTHTNIEAGSVDDKGDHVITYFDEGDQVNEGDLPQDQYDKLVELGVLQTVPPIKDPGVVIDTIAAKDEEIDRLKALLDQNEVKPDKADKELAKSIAEAAAKDAEIQALKAQLASHGIQPEPVVPPTADAERAAAQEKKAT